MCVRMLCAICVCAHAPRCVESKKLVDIQTTALACATSDATCTVYPKYALAATKASSDMVRVVWYVEKAGGSRVFV